MRRIAPGSPIGILNGVQQYARNEQMLRGPVAQKPRLRFQALLYHVADVRFALRVMDELDLWAHDSDGVPDRPNKDWISRYSEPIIDGEEIPDDSWLKAMRKVLDGYMNSRMLRAQGSALDVSLKLDERVMAGEASALDAKYAGDKLGWLWRAEPPATTPKQQTMSVGNLVINAGQPPKRDSKRQPRIDRKETKRLNAAVKYIEAKATEVK